MSLFEPSSIAIVGASTTPGKVGHDVLKNLVEQGFNGEIYPVNPKGGEILGKTVFDSISAIEADIDLAIIIIPAKLVPAAVEECATKNITNIVIISAGFSEVHTDEGKQLEQQIAALAAEHSLNIVGPNCLGILRPKHGMNASFASELPAAGSVALVSQSGAMAVALMDASPALNIGYSNVASIGNKAVLDECDFLEMCAADPETTVIGFYLENIRDGQRFVRIAKQVSRTKAIVLLKSGVSEHGKAAASSHTGALAGNDAAIDAACKAAGMYRAHNADEFLTLIQTLSHQPPLLSPNIGVITNAGGPGILATDAAETYGLTMPAFAEATLEQLKPHLPAAAGLVNPIDVIGDAGADRYRAALTACGHDPNIDGVAVVLTPQVMTPGKEVAEAVIEWSKAHPLMPVVTAFMGHESVGEARQLLRGAGIPSFDTPEEAIRALSFLLSQADAPAEIAPDSKRAEAAARIIGSTNGLLNEVDTEKLFRLYNLQLPQQKVAATADEAVQIANEIGYPVVAKISSPDILHKTDVGGIEVNLKNDAAVRSAFDRIVSSAREHLPQADIKGVLIQQFLPVGNEFIIGSLRDAAFGPLIMVGLGGIYTELFADTAFRLAPVTSTESYSMLQSLKSWRLLLGMRGQSSADIADLATVIEKISLLVSECPAITELDLNPVLVGTDRIVIADVKVVIRHAAA